VLVASQKAARDRAGLRTTVNGDGATTLQELLPIVTLRHARRTADALGDVLERELPAAAPSVLRAARFVIEELGANIVQHSGVADTGFGTVRAWPEKARLQVAFADAGMGFLASLQRHPELASRVQDDAEAIQLAVQKGLSSVGGRTNMGLGLGVLCDLSDRLDAELWIASGTALWHRRTAPHGLRVATTRAVPILVGTWICLDAPATPQPGGREPAR
jgi:anti-sigma regulatory factor (Ser/Thr protein kinase)